MLRPLLIGVALATGVSVPVATDTCVPDTELVRVPPTGLRDGDLVFRRGRDAIGRIVLSYGDQPRFSHVGMIVHFNGQVQVAHALPETPNERGGVRLDLLAVFSSPLRASEVGYFRLRELTADQQAQIRRYLLLSAGTPFDLRFEYSSDDALYCTELVLKALATVGLDLTSALETVRVVMLEEPAFAPDALWRSGRLEALAAPLQGGLSAARSEGGNHEL